MVFNLIKYEFIKTKTAFIRSVIFLALVMFLFGARIIGILMLVGTIGVYIWLSIYMANTFRDEMEEGTACLYYSIPEQTEKKILAKAIIGSFYLFILLLVMLGTQYIIVDWNQYGFMSERTGLDMIKDLIPYNVEALGSGNVFVLIMHFLEIVLDGILSFIIAFLAISIRRSKRNIKESRMDNRKIGNIWIITYGIISSIIFTAINLIVKWIPLNYMPNGIDVGISFTRIILVLTVGMFMLKYTGRYIDEKVDIYEEFIMRKRIIVLLSLFILLAACGKTENDLDKSENDQEITIPNEYEIEEKKLLKELDKDKNEIGNYIKLKELYLKYDEGEKADLIIDKALEKFVSRDEKLVLNMEKADTLNHLGDWEEAEEILLRMYGNMEEDKDYIGPNPVSRSEIYLKLGDIYYENDRNKYIKLQDDWNKFLEEEELVRFVQLLIEKDEIQRLNEFLEKIDMRRLEKAETIRVLSQYFNDTYMDVLLDKLIYSTSQSDIKGSGSKFFKYWYDNLIREYEIKGIYVDHNHIVLGDSDGIRDIYAVLENGSDYFIYTMDGVTGKVIDVIQGEGINDEYEIYFDQKLISVYGGKGINDSVRMLHLIRRNMEDERLDLYTENIELYKGFPGTLKFEKVQFDLHEELEVKTKDNSELIIIHPERGKVSMKTDSDLNRDKIYSVHRYIIDEDYSIFEREIGLYLDRERSKKVGSYKFKYIWDLEEEEIILDKVKIYNQKGIEI